MTSIYLDSISSHLRELCNRYPHRSTGSRGNIQAASYFAEQGERFGFEIIKQEFDCIDWQSGKVSLSTNGTFFEAFPSPWSLGVDSSAEVKVVDTLDKLKEAQLHNKIVLLCGNIAKEQLMPKKFPFYNPEEHREIIKLLEEKKPLSIITATSRNPETAGALYPFPLFEDGDFDIPSVYMTEEEGKKIRKMEGERVSLKFSATRIPAKGFNAIARKGDPSAGKILITAHIDTKPDTPGALDNASGVVVMLTMMEILKDYSGRHCLEFVAMNGEDYYAASGEIKYLDEMKKENSQILYNINMDALGLRGAKTGYTLHGDNDSFLPGLIEALSHNRHFCEIPPWYQGDHMIFVMKGIPALTLTSEKLSAILQEIAHTEKDVIENVDPDILSEVACLLSEKIR